MFYIQFRYRNLPLETIDEFETASEAREMLIEYRLGKEPDSYFYISRRACNAWKERD